MFWDQSFEGTFVLKLLYGLSKYHRQFIKIVWHFFAQNFFLRSWKYLYWNFCVFWKFGPVQRFARLAAGICLMSNVWFWIMSWKHHKFGSSEIWSESQICVHWRHLKIGNLVVKTKPIYNHDYSGENALLKIWTFPKIRKRTLGLFFVK